MNQNTVPADYAARMNRDGFAIIEDVVPAADVQTLLDAVAALPDGEEIRRKRSVYGVRNLLEICPAVCELAASASIRAFVTPILGHQCFAARAIFFDKNENVNWKLGWHQDSVISVRERVDVPGFVGWSERAGVVQVQPPAEILAEMLAIRVHLDNCHSRNGPLKVLPGSHKYGCLDDELDEWKRKVREVSCHLRSGGIVAIETLRCTLLSRPPAFCARADILVLEGSPGNMPSSGNSGSLSGHGLRGASGTSRLRNSGLCSYAS